jgi:5'-3' exoribonuclease 2
MPEFISSIDKSLKPNEMYMIDVMDFKKYLAYYLNDEVMPETVSEIDMRIKDYIFICFMLGNDFLPHFPTVNLRRNGMDFIMESYIYAIGKTKEHIIGETGDINWRVFRSMIMEMSNMEDKYMEEEYQYRNKQGKRYYPNNTDDEKKQYFINQPIIHREKEVYINPCDDYWQSRYYYTLFDIDSSVLSENEYQSAIKNICINYLEGLEWTYKYYSKGCIDWRWQYNYHYPPLLSDLKKYIPYFNETLVAEKPKRPVSDIVQLCYVLPVDEELWKATLHTQTKNQLVRIYKSGKETLDDPYFEWSYCKYFWECHVIFPNYPQVDEIESSL